jgi:hypothetical protein
MEGQDDVDAYWGGWHRVNGSDYASSAVPARFPAWLVDWTTGADGWLAAGVGAWLLHRYGDDPWVTLLRQSRTFRIPPTRVVHRSSPSQAGQAVDEARRLDGDLRAGRLPDLGGR